MTYFVATVSMFFAALFAAAAIHKARDLSAFLKTIAGYRLAPKATARPLAAAIVFMEAAAALLPLSSPTTGAAGLAVAAILLCIYSAAILINLARGATDFDCGCSWGGARSGTARLTFWHAARTVFLACLAVAALAVSVVDDVHADAVAMLFGLMLAAPFILLYASADVLIANWSRLSSEAI